jgi:hypothetical protein
MFSHRQQLIQQMQMIGGGQLGQQAASAIRHVAAQNGVWSLGNFGGVPPRSAISSAISNTSDGVPNTVGQTTNVSNASSDQSNTGCSSHDTNLLLKDIEEHDYRFVFNSCAVGMVRITSDFVEIFNKNDYHSFISAFFRPLLPWVELL